MNLSKIFEIVAFYIFVQCMKRVDREILLHSIQSYQQDRLHFLFNQASQLITDCYSFTTSQTRTTLGQLCAALWDSQSRQDMMQPGFERGTAVMPLALMH